MLCSALSAMTRCLENSHPEADNVVATEEKEEGPWEAKAGAVAPEEVKDPTAQKPKAPKARKPRKAAAANEEKEEPALSATPATDTGEQGDSAPVVEKEEPSDLPFAEGEAGPAQVMPENPAPMTPVVFRAKLNELRDRLGVKPDTQESILLSHEISARCNTLYGTPKPSTLPGDKMAEFVEKEMMGLTWNADRTGFCDNLPF